MSGGGTLRYFLEGEWRRADPLPPEFAIREVPSLDADDPEVLLHITKTWGPLTFPVLTGSLIPQSDAWNSRDRQDSIRLGPPGYVDVPIAMVTHHVRILQAIVEHWRAHQEGDSLAIWTAWAKARASDGQTLDRRVGRPGTMVLSDLWSLWRDYLNAALNPFSAQVSIVSDSTGRSLGGWEKRITAYSSIALQIRNDVAAGTRWHVCQNEPCHKLFAHQLGRAEAGQYRTSGVMFCTPQCARAQAQRRFRRKQAEAKKERPADG